MSIFNSCCIMVGMPYGLVVSEENKTVVDNLITDGYIHRGSKCFDSPVEENIIGFRLLSCDDITQIHVETLLMKYKEYNKKFYNIFDQFGNLYLTLDIT